MTPLERRGDHGTTANGDHPRGASVGASREARRRRIFDGVVASYIHDISVRAAPAGGEDHEPTAD